jgi:hypothetical protein
LELLSKIIQK